MLRRTSGAAGVAMLALVLAACVPATPASTGSPSPSPTASESSAPTAPPAPLSIPDCDTLLAIGEAQEIYGDAIVFYGEETFDASGFAIEQLGTTLAGATQSRRCIWVDSNSEGDGFQLIVAEADAASAAALQTALPGEGFTSVSMGTVTGFDGVIEADGRSYATTLLFTGDVIVYVSSTTTPEVSGQVAGATLDALRTANPDLGL